MGLNNKATLHVGKMSKLNCGNYLPRYAENGQKAKMKTERQRIRMAMAMAKAKLKSK